MYFNELSGPIFGWVDSKVYDQTLAATKDEIKAEQAAVGWCTQVIDTNGDGKITKPWQTAPRNGFDNQLYVTDTAGGGGGHSRCSRTWCRSTGSRSTCSTRCGSSQQPAHRGWTRTQELAWWRRRRWTWWWTWRRGRCSRGTRCIQPALDTLLANGGYSLYSVIPSPVDDSVWGVAETFPGYLIRLRRGNNPPETCMTQIFKVPSPGLDPRGVDIDSNGVVWTALAASSHLASFDVRKCKNLNGTPRRKTGWQPLPRRLEAVSDHRSEIPGHEHPDRIPLLQLDRPAGRFGLPSQHAHGNRIQLRLDSRPDFPAGSRTLGHDARSLSRSASMPADWMPVLMIQMLRPDSQAGRTARCGPTTEPTSCGTSKAERASRARKLNSRSARILWPVKSA